MGKEGAVQITIDPMRIRDLGEIMKIEKLSFPTPWSRYAFVSELLENDKAYYLVAKVDGRAVGYIGIWLIHGEGHVTNIAVHPKHRSQGIGRSLLEAMVHLAAERSIAKMTLEVRKSNATAIRLYETLGFKNVGIRPKYYTDNNEDAIIMWKEL